MEIEAISSHYLIVIYNFLDLVNSAEFAHSNYNLISEYGLSAYFTDDLRALLAEMPTKNQADCIDIIESLYDLGGEECKELYLDDDKVRSFILANACYITTFED